MTDEVNEYIKSEVVEAVLERLHSPFTADMRCEWEKYYAGIPTEFADLFEDAEHPAGTHAQAS